MLFLDKNPDLKPIDMDIYKYISANIDKVIYMRIRDLAEATHSSTASILRFCKKFECDGFSAFKIKLQIYRDQLREQQIPTLDETAILNFILRTKEPFFQEKIALAASLLAEKELILFIGLGSSNIIAEYGVLYFSSIFNMAFRIEDPGNQPIHFLNESVAEKLCIIALSVSGETLEIINYLSHFSLSKSSIISITNSSKSTIAQLSDVNIPYYMSTESVKGADVTSQVPALFTIEYLAKEVRKYRPID